MYYPRYRTSPGGRRYIGGSNLGGYRRGGMSPGAAGVGVAGHAPTSVMPQPVDQNAQQSPQVLPMPQGISGLAGSQLNYGGNMRQGWRDRLRMAMQRPSGPTGAYRPQVGPMQHQLPNIGMLDSGSASRPADYINNTRRPIQANPALLGGYGAGRLNLYGG